MKYLFLIPTLLILSCGPVPDTATTAATVDTVDTEITESDVHWGDLYIRDHCARCPDCCVFIEEDADAGGLDR